MSETEKVEVAAATVAPEVTVEEKIEAPAEKITETVVEDVKAAPAAPAVEETEGKGLGPVAGGAIGSTVVKGKKKPDAEKPEAAKSETVALFSKKSYHWAENGGALKSGYTIVDKAKADKWLTLSGVRIATPEEIANAFGAGK